MKKSISKTIIFMGCKSCGKSTQGKAIAQSFNLPFVDTDLVIEQNTGMSVRDFYTKNGASAFMQAEEKVCHELAESYADQSVVISTGGGICENAPALTVLKGLGTFVFLKLPVKVSVQRIMNRITVDECGNFHNVPSYIMVKNPKTLDEISALLTERFEQRTQSYQTIADIIVDIKNAPQEENLKVILGALNQ